MTNTEPEFIDSDRDVIAMNVIWNRLISVCEEQANVLLRAAFGPIVREAGDLSAGVFDATGAMMAQAVTGTPGHVNTMAASVRLMLEKIPPEALTEGDALITNDPWIGAGHIFDFVVVTPVFVAGRVVGYVASTSHIVDVGGLGWSADARSIYEEGVLIPVTKIRRGTSLNEDILGVITANSRVAREARGDVLSLIACNDAGVARLQDLMSEFHTQTLERIADFIFTRTRAATADAISEVPNGVYTHEMALDGYDAPILLKARMEVADAAISVDFEGSSPAVDRGINCPFNYSMAYASFGIKAAIAGHVPNNAAALEAIQFSAPPGLAVSAEWPSPVTARHVIGQALPDLMLGCLEQALPGEILAESSGALWTMSLAGRGAHPFTSLNVALGGMGARPDKDGLSTTAFPSGVGAVPVEIAEIAAPLIYHAKEFAPDSGGPGRHRGGLGQRIVVGAAKNEPLELSAAAFERLTTGPAGRAGGMPGSAGRVEITDGTVINDKGIYRIPAGERLVLQTPGGGGFGDPAERGPDAMARDVAEGLVSNEDVRNIYHYDTFEQGGEDQ